MIIYNPLDGIPIPHKLDLHPQSIFLMTRLGTPIPEQISSMRTELAHLCGEYDYSILDAQTRVTGRDILRKIWILIASAPLSIALIDRELPSSTLYNIFYELGVAQAMGKETLVIKSKETKIPSDLIRTEYIDFTPDFERKFRAFMQSIFENASYYETMADQLERNPLLSIDYYRRAFLITGSEHLREKAQNVLETSGVEERAANSVERMVSSF